MLVSELTLGSSPTELKLEQSLDDSGDLNELVDPRRDTARGPGVRERRTANWDETNTEMRGSVSKLRGFWLLPWRVYSR